MIFSCFLFTFVMSCIVSDCHSSVKMLKWSGKTEEPFQNLVNYLLEEMTNGSKCIVFILDPYYRRLIRYNWKHSNGLPHYSIYIRESDTFSPPKRRIMDILNKSRDSRCDVYVILVANGWQVSQLLEYSERNRLINTHAKFLLLYDSRLVDIEMKTLWNRIINVLLINRQTVLTQRSNETVKKEWFNIETVFYPVKGKSFVRTRHVNTWYKDRMTNPRIQTHFENKTQDLKMKKLNVAIFEHIPAVTRNCRKLYSNHHQSSEKALGVEFEILRILAEKINFKPNFYSPENIEVDKWGTINDNGTHNGLLGEAVQGNAAFLLGDLYYNMLHNQLLDLSYPYNAECLTFLTPESLTENSWKLLIAPFTFYAWIGVFFILLLGSTAFHLFAVFYEKRVLPHVNNGNSNVNSSTGCGNMAISETKTLVLRKDLRRIAWINKKLRNEEASGLDLFTQIQNSFLYTFSMLLQVSLPRLPKPWGLRVFIGWWWLYTILVTVAYRASLTAALANPVGRITIDTLEELAKSGLTVGGWGEDKRELFVSSTDRALNIIGSRFQLTSKEDEAVAKVANGTFSYYENTQTLQEARAKRQLLEDMQKRLASLQGRTIDDRNLHIMQECVILMPISIGMDRNSPLKPRVDHIVRQVVESGFVEKWLSDVTEWSKIVEIKAESSGAKALVDLHKLHGGLVALGIGYFLACVALIGERIYWKYFVMRDPAFDKYQMDIFYSVARTRNNKKIT